jgi:general secretion pathway protein I
VRRAAGLACAPRRTGRSLAPRRTGRGFTLVEVLVALVVVALGLTALMVAVSGTARTSGYLRDKTLAQWIALNRVEVVRLTVNRLGDTHDQGELDFANRKWHYDTRYFDSNVTSMKRVVVRVWAGDAKTKGNPIAESTGFIGTTIGTPGLSNVDWTTGTSATANNTPCAPANGTSATGTVVNGPGGTTIINGSGGTTSASGQPNCVNGTLPVAPTPTATLPQTQTQSNP